MYAGTQSTCMKYKVNKGVVRHMKAIVLVHVYVQYMLETQSHETKVNVQFIWSKCAQPED